MIVHITDTTTKKELVINLDHIDFMTKEVSQNSRDDAGFTYTIWIRGKSWTSAADETLKVLFEIYSLLYTSTHDYANLDHWLNYIDALPVNISVALWRSPNVR